MSCESKICRVVIDVVDIAKLNITTRLLESSNELGLSPESISRIMTVVSSQLDTSFEGGITAIQRELSSYDNVVSPVKGKKTKEVRSDKNTKS